MAKTKGKTYLIKYTSALGYKSKSIVHAANQKAAEKYAKDIHPNAGTIKVERYVTKGVELLHTSGKPAKTHESTESMVHSSEEKTLDSTFTRDDESHEDD